MESIKGNEATKVTTLSDSELVMAMDAAGTLKPITVANFKNTLLGKLTMAAVCDNVMIAYTTNSDSDALVRYSKVEDWPTRAAANYAIGVLLVSGNQKLIIAPTEAPTALKWASANGTNIPNLTDITSKATAADDFNGKANTAAIIAGSTSAAVTNTSTYAAGFCNNYSRVDSKNHGIPAGSWFLPSLGQLLLMHAYKNQIKYALSLIAGSSALQETSYWSSTEYSANNAWYLYFSTGYMYYYYETSEVRVRPVAALA